MRSVTVQMFQEREPIPINQEIGRRIAARPRFSNVIDMVMSYMTKNEAVLVLSLFNTRLIWAYNLWGVHEATVVL